MRESLIMKSLAHLAIDAFQEICFNSFEHRNLLEQILLMEYIKSDTLDSILEKEKRGMAPPEWTNKKKFHSKCTTCIIKKSYTET